MTAPSVGGPSAEDVEALAVGDDRGTQGGASGRVVRPVQDDHGPMHLRVGMSEHSGEKDALRAALAPYLYEAYRLGKYGQQEYLPMWHEKPASEHAVPWPEVDGAVTAALSVLRPATCGFAWAWEGSDDDHLHTCRHPEGHPGRHVCKCRSWQPSDPVREAAQTTLRRHRLRVVPPEPTP